MGCCGAKGVEDYSAQGRSPPQSCLDKFSTLSNINDPLLLWIMITKNASILSQFRCRYHRGGNFYGDGCGVGFSTYMKSVSISNRLLADFLDALASLDFKLSVVN